VLVRLLEEIGGRAALVAGTIESDAGAGLGLGFDGGMSDELRKDERGVVERQIAVPDRGDDCREAGAGLRDGREGGAVSGDVCLGQLHDAVVCAVSSAAGREIRIGAGREGKHGRDQREAEEEKQGDAEKASHSVIVAKLLSRRGGGRLWSSRLPWWSTG
jgi:hypothetical protein